MRLAAAVDDRVARDRVEPGGARAAVGLVRAGGAPDRGERLLDCILGAHPVAEPPEGEAENRPRIAVVERLEGVRIPPGDAPDQVAVGQPAEVWQVQAGRFPVALMGHGGWQGEADAHLLGISTEFHVCWIAAHRGVHHKQDPYQTLKNRLRASHV